MFPSGRSLQQSDANRTSLEVCISISCTLKHQRCWCLALWNFVSLHPIREIEVRFRPEPLLSIREYASYYRLPLLRRVVGQYELETLPHFNLRLHLIPCVFSAFRSRMHGVVSSITVFRCNMLASRRTYSGCSDSQAQSTRTLALVDARMECRAASQPEIVSDNAISRQQSRIGDYQPLTKSTMPAVMHKSPAIPNPVGL